MSVDAFERLSNVLDREDAVYIMEQLENIVESGFVNFIDELRANARKLFRKLEKLGFGELRKDGKIGRQYHFYVKGMMYPEPKTEQAKVETPAKA